MKVYNSHSGKSTEINPDSFLSLQELKDALFSLLSIPQPRQIIMTSRATQLRLSNLPLESELFIFDRNLLSNPASTPPPSSSPLLPLNAQPFPSLQISKPTQADYVDLFESRASWAHSLLARADSLHASLLAALAETATIRRSVDVAFAHLAHHVNSINSAFDHVLANDVLTHDIDPVSEDHIALLNQLTVLDSLGGGTLSSWLDSTPLPDIDSTNTRDRVRDIKFVADTVAADADQLRRDIAEWHTESFDVSAGSVFDDLRVLARKIDSDAEYVSDLPTTPASIRSITRMALLHTREYLPALAAALSELWDLNREAQSRKVAVQLASLRHLHTLAQVQSRASPIRPDIASLERELDSSASALAARNHVKSLPLAYGAYLVELVRRREWTESVRALSTRVAEEFAASRESEVARRRNLTKRFPFLADPSRSVIDSSVASIELNLVSRDIQVSRGDVLAYISKLETLDQTAAAEVRQLLDNVNNPEIDIPRFTVPTITPDGKLHDKLRAYESRIRRLEDLLHNQYRPSALRHNSAPESRTDEVQAMKAQFARQARQLQESQQNLQEIEIVKQDLLANLAQQESEFQQERKAMNEEISGLKAKIYAMEDELNDSNLELLEQELNLVRQELEETRARESELQTELSTAMYNFKRTNDELQTELTNLKRVNDKLDSRTERARDLSQRLYSYFGRWRRLMDTLNIKHELNDGDANLLYWMNEDDSVETDMYASFISAVSFDHDSFAQTFSARLHDSEAAAAKWHGLARSYRDKYRRLKEETISYKSFKPGDLALFLPTQNKIDDENRIWAAFNDGAPFCFLRRKDGDGLESRQWLVGRIAKMQEDDGRFVVDLENKDCAPRPGSDQDREPKAQTESDKNQPKEQEHGGDQDQNDWEGQERQERELELDGDISNRDEQVNGGEKSIQDFIRDEQVTGSHVNVDCEHGQADGVQERQEVEDRDQGEAQESGDNNEPA